MSDIIRSRSTSGSAPKMQIQSSIDALTCLCVPFDGDPLKAPSLAVRMSYATISRLKLCRVQMGRRCIAHTACRAKLSEYPYVKVLFQTRGVSYFKQDGRQIKLISGDCLAYDASCPHTIVSRAFTRHEVVIMPKDLLLERGIRLQKMAASKLSARTGTGRIAYKFMHAAFEEATRLSANSADGVADSLLELLLLPFREVGPMFDRVGPEMRLTLVRSSSSASVRAILDRRIR